MSVFELKRLVKGTLHETEIESERDKQKKEERLLTEGLTLGDLSTETLSDEDVKAIKVTMNNVWDDLNMAKDTKNEAEIAKAQQRFDKAKNYVDDGYNVKVIPSSKGLFFRHNPKLSKEANNVRINVKGQINNAIKDFKKHLPKLWEHLEAYIDTGKEVEYKPPIGFPKWHIRWNS